MEAAVSQKTKHHVCPAQQKENNVIIKIKRKMSGHLFVALGDKLKLTAMIWVFKLT